MLVSIIAAVALSTSTSAAQTPADDQAPTANLNDWLENPKDRDIKRTYPIRAGDLGVSGIVTLRCDVSWKGPPPACQVLDEKPEGWGFGDAALKLAAQFKFKTSNAMKTPQYLRFPISFQTESGFFYTALKCYGAYVAESALIPSNSKIKSAALAYSDTIENYLNELRASTSSAGDMFSMALNDTKIMSDRELKEWRHRCDGALPAELRGN